ncbi:acyltransferase [Candidatus Sulfurimonas baltica]|uniref:Acyltransferase n=1 Tax=Candidatus Sulfurimonas baltica TaxID=2740404 RepID=A0A7S7LW90_9BACT|nr:acyltransferase [Candidatus Sulfurimonas baltica]QOY52682.1 acyltransferase [Candidatus Sulfurimonas baltica]
MNLFDLETPPALREQILKYFASSTMTDVERARLFGLPENCRMREGAKIISPENLKIGKNVWIGENAILDASGGLEIGDNTQIGLGVYIWSHDSYKSAIMGINTKENKKGIIRKKTTIGKNCFIGGPSVIMPGVSIHDKCVISPMSVVYEDLPDKTIYQPYKTFFDLRNEVQKKDLIIKEMQNDLELIKRNLGI